MEFSIKNALKGIFHPKHLPSPSKINPGSKFGFHVYFCIKTQVCHCACSVHSTSVHCLNLNAKSVNGICESLSNLKILNHIHHQNIIRNQSDTLLLYFLVPTVSKLYFLGNFFWFKNYTKKHNCQISKSF